MQKALLTLSIIITLSTLGYDGFVFWQMRERNIALETTLEDRENLIGSLQKDIRTLKVEKNDVSNALETEKQTNLIFQDQIKTITGTVGVLEKLSKTDTELLKKYSKIYFLNENYIPPKLISIDPKYLFIKDKPVEIHEGVWPHLQKMFDAAYVEGVNIQILSGYRSFGTQATLKSAYKVTYGAGTANKFSADQGYSEHQLATTLDFTTTTTGATLIGFEKTPAYMWLLGNAYKYGFILSYPKENTYYIFEPWHFRFVGVALATKIHDQGTYFYALDQREINQYLVNIFD